jgi:hypothetical protein
VPSSDAVSRCGPGVIPCRWGLLFCGLSAKEEEHGREPSTDKQGNQESQDWITGLAMHPRITAAAHLRFSVISLLSCSWGVQTASGPPEQPSCGANDERASASQDGCFNAHTPEASRSRTQEKGKPRQSLPVAMGIGWTRKFVSRWGGLLEPLVVLGERSPWRQAGASLSS